MKRHSLRRVVAAKMAEYLPPNEGRKFTLRFDKCGKFDQSMHFYIQRVKALVTVAVTVISHHMYTSSAVRNLLLNYIIQERSSMM
jgi:hypothetical protein